MTPIKPAMITLLLSSGVVDDAHKNRPRGIGKAAMRGERWKDNEKGKGSEPFG